jgi:uncharacterized protein RhaS with RHS repeats
MRENTTWSYFLTDNLGSVVGVTDSNGALTSETRYLPFGEVRTDVGTITQTPVKLGQADFGYTFQRSIADSGLMDYRARMPRSVPAGDRPDHRTVCTAGYIGAVRGEFTSN